MKSFYLFLAVCFSAAPCLAAPSLNDPSLKVEQVVSGLSLPTTMAFIGPDDILVLQKDDGKVRRVINGVLQSGEVLDVAVANDSERGLLGIALHPDFTTNHFVYLYYTESSTDGGSPLGNRVYKYTWNSTASTLTLAQISPILDLPVTPGPNHDGGIITFGPDGKLYVINGDLNRNGQLQNFPAGLGPDDTSVIHRLNDNGTTPTDNPFFSPGDPTNPIGKYYAYGIRNSFGMAFDPVTGKLWDTENGENTFDEINLVEPGFNSGWERLMGPLSRDPEGENESDLFQLAGSHYADPKFSWRDTVGPTAIVFLDSAELGPQYEDDVFVGDINNGNLYHFVPNANRNGFVLSGALSDLVADNNTSELNPVIFGTGFDGITDLKVGPDGLLYVVSIGDGAIYRISQVVDVAPPDTIIDSGPSNPTNQTSAAFTFHSTESGSSFQCQLDNGGFSACTSPRSYSALAAGSHTFQVRATDGAGNTDPTPASYDWTVDSTTQTPLSVGASSLPDAEVGVNYSADLGIGGGTAPYTVTRIKGSLPSGLIAASNGISGTPSPTKKSVFTLQVTDQVRASITKQFKIKVFNALSITTNALKAGKVGKNYKAKVSANGGKAPFNWSETSGALAPLGLTLDPTTGVISGTPTGPGSPSLTFQVTDSLGGTDQQILMLTIN